MRKSDEKFLKTNIKNQESENKNLIFTCHTPSLVNLDENKNPGIVMNISDAVTSEREGGRNGVQAGRIGVNTESVITS